MRFRKDHDGTAFVYAFGKRTCEIGCVADAGWRRYCTEVGQELADDGDRVIGSADDGVYASRKRGIRGDEHVADRLGVIAVYESA